MKYNSIKLISILMILSVLFISDCHKNRPPHSPYTPSGPSVGVINKKYNFSSLAIDPDGDDITMRFDWGDGDTSAWLSDLAEIWVASEQTITMSHLWISLDTFNVRVQAKDEKEHISKWSLPHYIVIINQSPHPSIPEGPSEGSLNHSYQFFSSAIDLDKDSVTIRFDWGDGDTSDWSLWVLSEDTVRMRHGWLSTGIYNIKAQAKDKREKISEWSLPHLITIVTNLLPIPAIPEGPSEGRTNTDYLFSGSALDPDSDSVAIRFDWGDGDTSEWSIWVASGQSIWMSHSWLAPDTYYVKAQAKDSFKVTSSWSLPHAIVIKNPSRGLGWICATPSAAWTPRESHASVVFNNKIWVAGGHVNGYSVWSSPDGVNWTCETYSAGFGERYDYEMVVFDNKIWVLGGNTFNAKNDVWYSSDGKNWTCATHSAQWSPRAELAAEVFNNKIWVLGGGIWGRQPFRDVWFSTDGLNWTRATRIAEWRARKDLTSVVFDNKIWVLGGSDGQGRLLNDVWYSTDSTHWTEATDSAPWSGRIAHTSVVFDNKIWVIGGSDAVGPLNDVWYSTNGRDWVQETSLTIFSPRWDHTSVVFNDKIWVLGGGPPQFTGQNDVWYRDSIYKK